MAAPTPTRPTSDVSPWVGLVGLAGLLVWALACREWPNIAPHLGVRAPQGRMDGPNAALFGVLCAGVPMVLWSVLVDKVHRRASTGIDWDNPRPLSATLDVSITKLAGLWATWAAIAGLYGLCSWYWSGSYLFAMHVLGWSAPLLFVGSLGYVPWLDRYLADPRDGAWHLGAALIGRETFDPAMIRAHARSWAVKGFYCAFMLQALPGNWARVIGDPVDGLTTNPQVFARALTDAMFMIDVQIAMVGYILTMRPLDAQIRSANPLLAGWLAALMCYPPFQIMGQGRPIYYQQATADWTVWLAGHPGLLWLWAAILVALTGIYAWATVAFGLRFSNLTWRGTISNGPYALSRHPAYLSKNLFWWFEALPFLVTSHSWVDALRNSFFLGCVSAIYFWRAKTEEAHLLAEDAKYREYHAWMAANGPITRLLQWRRNGTAPALQPAE